MDHGGGWRLVGGETPSGDTSPLLRAGGLSSWAAPRCREGPDVRPTPIYAFPPMAKIHPTALSKSSSVTMLASRLAALLNCGRRGRITAGCEAMSPVRTVVRATAVGRGITGLRGYVAVRYDINVERPVGRIIRVRMAAGIQAACRDRYFSPSRGNGCALAWSGPGLGRSWHCGGPAGALGTGVTPGARGPRGVAGSPFASRPYQRSSAWRIGPPARRQLPGLPGSGAAQLLPRCRASRKRYGCDLSQSSACRTQRMSARRFDSGFRHARPLSLRLGPCATGRPPARPLLASRRRPSR